MLQLIDDLPETVVGVRAINEVTEEDYKQVVLPALEIVHKKFEKVSLIIVLETSASNYTYGAWLNDIKVGLKYFTNWHRIAIVSDEKLVQIVTDVVSYIMPGECKGFPMEDLATAKLWVAA